MAANLLYDRPDLDQQKFLPALYVDGIFPSAYPADSYEGRIQIYNGIGECRVRQLAGDTLPSGSQLYVDQATKQVVVAWPGYVTQAAPIPNPGFEDGINGWEAGAGWSVGTDNPIAGARSAGYLNAHGSSIISSLSRYPVNPGVPIFAQCQVRQGASSEGNAGGCVRLEYRDADGVVIDSRDGNMVLSASKNAVYPSRLNSSPPPNAATVNIAGNGVRYRENKKVWVDSFQWDHYVTAAGTNIERSFNLTLQVSDSRGRSYIWTGSIAVMVWDGSWIGLLFPGISVMPWRGVANAIYYQGKGRMLVGGHDGNIWWSDDRGATFTRTTSPLNSTPYYTYAFDYNDRDGVLVACGSYISRSLDGGQTWGRVYNNGDGAWWMPKWIPEWNIFIVVGGGAYTRRILTLDYMGASPANKSGTGNYEAVFYSPMFDRAVCLPSNTNQYAVCTGDNTASTWVYKTAPEVINCRQGIAVLPNGDVWVCGSSGYMISKDGGDTWNPAVSPFSLPGVPAGYNRQGFVAYDPDLNLLLITPYLSGSGSSSARQYISRDMGQTFQLAANPVLPFITMADPTGVSWSRSAKCFVGSDRVETSPNIFFSKTGAFR